MDTILPGQHRSERTPDRRDRSPRLGRLARWSFRGLLSLLVLAVIGTALQAIAEARDGREHPAPGELVALPDGRSLHLVVDGEEHEGPVVVLETGMGGMTSAWGWIQPALAEQVTVVSYDRPGLGWSDPSPDGPDAEHVVADLRAGLDALGLSGRGFVLAGHSLGGHYVRAFAQAHPDEVVGMVLVDPSHERQAEAIDGYEVEQRRSRLLMRLLQVTSRIGLHRVFDPFAAAIADLPEPTRTQALVQQVRPAYFDAYLAEFAALDRIGADLAADDVDLGDLPLRVLVAGHSPTPAGRQAVEAAAALREQLAGLSTRGRTVVFDDAAHVTIVTQRQHAARVTAAILDVAAESRPG
ncbi:alpha/beta fold hydrolase [Egicoccus sp. AB-alg2]|uniref:alpha/beta hydrolase n=1 Tax=Egicoccus sp. AB-alg2 TaxID=3242693 RepID=UPI00359D4610